MPRAQVGDIELEYETFGDRSKPAALLVMGLAYQMIEWDERVCRLLAERGFWVIRYDNRDVGLSTKIGSARRSRPARGARGQPRPRVLARRHGCRRRRPSRCTRRHGRARGGRVDGRDDRAAHRHQPPGARAQPHLDHVDSRRPLGRAGGERRAARALHTARPDSRGEDRAFLALRRLINGRDLPFDEDEARRRATLAVDRSFHPEGALRQAIAIATAPDRAPGLRALTIPSLVIHGENDPLIPPDNGRQTAAALPGARLMMIPAMGHNLPPHVWPEVLDAVVEVTSLAAPA